jgi:thiosulfate/3-mercaptopyruvate sulfurtransferase
MIFVTMNTRLTAPLLSAQALLGQLTQEPWVILNCSFDLVDTQAGWRSHLEAHIPGASYAHLEKDLSGPKTNASGQFLGRHPLRTRAQYAALMGQWGIEPTTPVLVYDAQAGMFAARLWWTLRWMGHTQVWLLDGGLQAWQSAGGIVSRTPQQALASTEPYPTLPPQLPSVQAQELLDQLSQSLVIDARAPERFRGDTEPLDAVAGHIPGAKNRFFKDNLQTNGCFKPPAQLRAEFTQLLGGHTASQVVHQCGSGTTACHNLLAMEIAGLHGTTLYPGSWSEWSAKGSAFGKVQDFS